ncbi:MAG: DUF4352 domain-containing protein [Acidobacteria bacterium]|nr:DUF4352 domain-containing protein [Acidobacteriota bacterium]
MNSNVNLESAVGVLSFLGSGFVLLVLALILVHALWAKKFRRAKGLVLAGFGVAGLYFGLMLAFSLASGEKVLARGEEKYFCEIDCHLAYSVIGVRKAKTLGGATAGGEFYVVTLRTRFDEQTISPRRGNATLTPNPRALAVSDEQGRAYRMSEEGMRQLGAERRAGEPLETPLRPGESYTTEVVFDLPGDAKNPVLLLNESMLPTRFIIGHENSFLHGQTKFRLDPLA